MLYYIKMSSLLQQIKSLDINKQNTLQPGTNITIDANNVISATGGTDGGGITQEQLDAKEDLITTTTDISSNTLTTVGDLNVGGKIIAPNRVHFRARRSSNITVSGVSSINYNDVRFNLGGGSYNNGIFTARTAGKYFFFANFLTVPDVQFIVDIYHFNSAQDLRQGRACQPRPPGFRRQNLDAHPPGPSKKTKWTPTRPLGECLSNTPTHPAQRKKAKSGRGRPVPAWGTPGRPVTCRVRTPASRLAATLVTTEPLPHVGRRKISIFLLLELCGIQLKVTMN